MAKVVLWRIEDKWYQYEQKDAQNIKQDFFIFQYNIAKLQILHHMTTNHLIFNSWVQQLQVNNEDIFISQGKQK